jgi:hypothetical protein
VQIRVGTQDEVITRRETSVLNANYRLAASDANGFAVDV